MQNLTSKLVSCFSFFRKQFPAVRRDDVVTIVFERFMFHLMLLIYLSQGLHAPFFCVYLPLRQFPRVNPADLSIALFGVFSGTG